MHFSLFASKIGFLFVNFILPLTNFKYKLFISARFLRKMVRGLSLILFKIKMALSGLFEEIIRNNFRLEIRV